MIRPWNDYRIAPVCRPKDMRPAQDGEAQVVVMELAVARGTVETACAIVERWTVDEAQCDLTDAGSAEEGLECVRADRDGDRSAAVERDTGLGDACRGTAVERGDDADVDAVRGEGRRETREHVRESARLCEGRNLTRDVDDAHYVISLPAYFLKRGPAES